METICPCKGCLPPRRSSVCHSTCTMYAKWKVEYDEAKTRIQEAKRIEEMFTYFGKSKKKNITFIKRGEET